MKDDKTTGLQAATDFVLHAEGCARDALGQCGQAIMYMSAPQAQDLVPSHTLVQLSEAAGFLRRAVGDMGLARMKREKARRELEADVAQEAGRVGGPGEPVQPGGDGRGDGGPGVPAPIDPGKEPVAVGPDSVLPGCTRSYNISAGRYEWRDGEGNTVAVVQREPGGEVRGPRAGRQTWLD